MSITSGPMLPPYTGISRLPLPSPEFSVALPFASMVFRSLARASGGPQFAHQRYEVRLAGLGLSHHQVQQVVVGERQQLLERARLGLVHLLPRARPVTLEHEIQFQQPPSAAPLQPLQCLAPHHTARLTSSSLILPMASVGLSPLGQTSTQFMIVWQRNRRYG